MGFQVLLGSLLACTVSSVPLDAGYGVPAAPLPVPPQPFVHAAPLNYAPDFLPFAPAPLPLGPEQPALIPDHLRFAPEPHFIGPAPIPAAVAAPILDPIAAPLAAPIPAPIIAPLSAPIAAPIAAPLAAPITAPSSQFHAQDEFGQFSFGYENINSA